jgi:hypothetical protein
MKLCWQVSSTVPGPPSPPSPLVTTFGLFCTPAPALSCTTSTPAAVPPEQSTMPVQPVMRTQKLPNEPPRMGAR